MPSPTVFACGHPCPSKCHQLVDHSKIRCRQLVSAKCPKGHDQTHECHQTLPTCRKCEREIKLQEAKQKEDFERRKKQDAEQLEYDQRIEALEKRITQERQALQETQLAEERRQAIELKEKDLQEATARTMQAKSVVRVPPTPNSPNQPLPNLTSDFFEYLRRLSPQALLGLHAASSSTASDPAPTSPTVSQQPATPAGQAPTTPAGPAPPASSATPTEDSPSNTKKPVINKEDGFPPLPPSESKLDWQYQKNFEGARSDAIDDLMEMIGLETVKAKVLAIKAKIDVAVRQGTSLKDERLNIAMLGNPGTGLHRSPFLLKISD